MGESGRTGGGLWSPSLVLVPTIDPKRFVLSTRLRAIPNEFDNIESVGGKGFLKKTLVHIILSPPLKAF